MTTSESTMARMASSAPLGLAARESQIVPLAVDTSDLQATQNLNALHFHAERRPGQSNTPEYVRIAILNCGEFIAIRDTFRRKVAEWR